MRALSPRGQRCTAVASLTPGPTDDLRATLTFPAAAGNTLQGLSSTVSFSFTGTQRVATNK